MTNTWTDLAFELIWLGQAVSLLGDLYIRQSTKADVSAEIGHDAMTKDFELHSSGVSSPVNAYDDVHVDCDVVGIRVISVYRNLT